MNILGFQDTRLPRSDIDDRWQGLFQYKAAVAYALVLVLPLVYTLDVNTFRVNRNSGLLLFLAAAILAPKFDRSLLRPPMSHRIGGVLVVTGIFFVAWQWQHGDLWLNSQLLLYCGVAALFPISITWFRRTGSEGLKYVFMLKLAGVLGATALFVLAIADLAGGPEPSIGLLVREPPIYRDVRHFNHDQFFVLALGAYFYSLSRSRVEAVLWLCVCVAIGYVLAWSGGRAAIGALLIFLAICAWFNLFSRRSIIVWASALLVALILLIATGRADLLLMQLGKVDVTGPGGITSNRLEIWAGSLGVWWDHWATMVFGLGPDAMRMAVRAKIGFPPVVQAHNTIVQVLIEFGFIGLILFLWGSFVVARRVIVTLTAHGVPQAVRISAALLLALSPYMLVDGILYHSIPLIMVMLLTAYLFHYDVGSSGSPAHPSSSGEP
jgi:hypothetical protein